MNEDQQLEYGIRCLAPYPSDAAWKPEVVPFLLRLLDAERAKVTDAERRGAADALRDAAELTRRDAPVANGSDVARWLLRRAEAIEEPADA